MGPILSRHYFTLPPVNSNQYGNVNTRRISSDLGIVGVPHSSGSKPFASGTQNACECVRIVTLLSFYIPWSSFCDGKSGHFNQLIDWDEAAHEAAHPTPGTRLLSWGNAIGTISVRTFDRSSRKGLSITKSKVRVYIQ